MKHQHRNRFLHATWINVIGNALKIVVEGGIGFAFGSLALIADAAQSIADLVGSLVILIWGRLAYDEADRTHPHGHVQIEPLTALFVGALLVLIGLKTGYDSIKGLVVLHELHFSVYLLAGSAFAALDMGAVYLLTVRANRQVNSPSLRAMAQDCLSDLLFTAAVFAGVVGVALGYPYLDPAAGALVSLLVVGQGITITWENINYLAGAAPPEAKQEDIRNAAKEHPAVRGIHDFTAFYVGPVIEVELHVEIDGDLSLHTAHDIETKIKQRILDVDDVYDVHIHLDPSGIGEWKSAPEDTGKT
jgi:cation diffusion facilitator family transporter